MNQFLFNRKILTFLVCFFYFLFFIFNISRASTLYFLPQGADVYEGESFIVEAGIDTENKEINAIEGQIDFPGDRLQVAAIEKGGSAVGLWIECPIYINDLGRINFSGGMPGGFSGQGTLFKIIFEPKTGKQAPFSAEIKFNEQTQVLLNDGKGTLDASKFLAGNYTVKEKAKDLINVVSSSHPDQNIWYRDNNFALRWDLTKDAEYSYLLSKDSASGPDEAADKPEGDLVWMGAMSYRGLEDGIYYFSVKQRALGGSWSEKVNYRAMVDATAPSDFTTEITEIDGKRYLVFLAKDITSGIDHYKVSEEKNWQIRNFKLRDLIPKSNILNSKSWIVATSPYFLKDQELQSEITVMAIDKAGNERVAVFPPQGSAKDFENYAFWSIIIILAIISYFIGKVLWRKFF